VITLETIAQRHQEWIKLSMYLGAHVSEAEDIVQTMYLKVAMIQQREGSLERITHYSGGLNTIYVFKMLQTACVDIKREQQKTLELYIEDPIQDPAIREHAYFELMKTIKGAIDELHEYDQMLLELHFVYGHSMREIEKRTGIPTHSVFNSIKNAKKQIKHKAEGKFNEYAAEARDTEQVRGPRGRYREDHEGYRN
jgi:RNA polymerase sigma factor (sigma-70 family)